MIWPQEWVKEDQGTSRGFTDVFQPNLSSYPHAWAFHPRAEYFEESNFIFKYSDLLYYMDTISIEVMHFCDTNDVLFSGMKEKFSDGWEVMEMCKSVWGTRNDMGCSPFPIWLQLGIGVWDEVHLISVHWMNKILDFPSTCALFV